MAGENQRPLPDSGTIIYQLCDLGQLVIHVPGGPKKRQNWHKTSHKFSFVDERQDYAPGPCRAAEPAKSWFSPAFSKYICCAGLEQKRYSHLAEQTSFPPSLDVL